MQEPVDIKADEKLLAAAWSVGKNAAVELGLDAKAVGDLDEKGMASLFGVQGDEPWWDWRVQRDKLAAMLTPRPWDVARKTARAEIARRGLTAEQVRALGYAHLAAICGVTLGPKGESPGWFEFIPERNRLAAEIEDAAKTTELTAWRLAVQAQVDRIIPREKWASMSEAEVNSLLRRID